MASDSDSVDGTLLGRSVASPERYSPDVLYPIDRSTTRQALGINGESLPFRGEDVWHAWELSWLGPDGCPRAAVARLHVPCDSPAIVESKSLKLYLNSLNHKSFSDMGDLGGVISRDLSAVVGSEVGVEVLMLHDERLVPAGMPGDCIDALQPLAEPTQPEPSLLHPAPGADEQRLYSHLLRSLCPVTAQPDFATLLVRMRGARVQEQSLLTYLLGYRQHQGFHEQCVEQIYRDLQAVLKPAMLEVQALYTRRGGLDINPFRSSERGEAPLLRSYRQ